MLKYLIATIIVTILLGVIHHFIRCHRERAPKIVPPPTHQPPQENMEDLLASIRATDDPVELFHLVGRATTLPAAAQQECIRAAHIQFATRIAV